MPEIVTEWVDPVDAPRIAAECASAWQDPAIPNRQMEGTLAEIERFRNGYRIAPFNALVDCLNHLPLEFLYRHYRPTLLDVGASWAYYREVLRLKNFHFFYKAVDYSEAFKSLALSIWPEIDFEVQDVRELSFPDNSFDIVISGGTISYVYDYENVIARMSRIASQYICLHRTPIVPHGPRQFFIKDAYGVPCLESHFNEGELIEVFKANNLELMYSQSIFFDPTGFSHRNYLVRKSA